MMHKFTENPTDEEIRATMLAAIDRAISERAPIVLLIEREEKIEQYATMPQDALIRFVLMAVASITTTIMNAANALGNGRPN